MRPLEHVEPGGERLLKWAREKLTALTRFRLDVGLPVLRKHYVVNGLQVNLRSSEFGDLIRITGGVGGFLVVPFIITPEDDELTGVRSFVPRTLDSIVDYPVTVINVSSYPFFAGGRALTAATDTAPNPDNHGYLTDQEHVSGVGAFPGMIAVVRHGGAVYRIRDDGVVAPLSSATPIAGSTVLSYVLQGIHSKGGDRIVAYLFDPGSGQHRLDEITLATVGGVPQATYVTQILSPFGQEITSFDREASLNPDFPAADVTYTDDQQTVITHDITFPISMADGGQSAMLSNTARSVRSDDRHTGRAAEGHEGPPGVNSATSFINNRILHTVAFRLSNGFERTYVIHDETLVASGSRFQQTSPDASSGSGSATWSKVESQVAVLHSDAMLPSVLLEITETTTSAVQTGTSLGANVTNIVATVTVVVRKKVILLVEDEERVVRDDVLSTDVSPGVTIASVGQYDAFGTDLSTHTVDVVNFEGNPYFSANRLGTSIAQFGAHVKGEYLGYAKDITAIDTRHHVFGHKTNLSALKLAVVNRVLEENHPGPGPFVPVTDVSGYEYGFDEIRVV